MRDLPTAARRAMLILAEASDYFGERAPAKPKKDQPDLPLDPDADND